MSNALIGENRVRAATERAVSRDEGWHLGSLLVVGEEAPAPCATWRERLIAVWRAMRARTRMKA